MEEGADDGDILSQEIVLISFEDDAESLYKRLTSVALTQLEDFHLKLKQNSYKRVQQNHSRANLWRKRGKADGKIDFRRDCRTSL